MLFDKLIEVIDESQNLTQTQKNLYKGQIARAETALFQKNTYTTILESVGVKHPYDIAAISSPAVRTVSEINSVIFFSVSESGYELPIWGVVVYNEERQAWNRLPEMSHTKEGAMLVYLQHKLYGNQNFSLKSIFHTC